MPSATRPFVLCLDRPAGLAEQENHRSRTIYDAENRVTGSKQYEINGEHSFTAASQLDAYSADITQDQLDRLQRRRASDLFHRRPRQLERSVYDARGLVIETKHHVEDEARQSGGVDAHGLRRQRPCGAFHRPLRPPATRSYATQTIYDGMGRVTSDRASPQRRHRSRSPGPAQSRSLLEPAARERSLHSGTEYDGAGRVTQTTDQFGTDTQYTYDADGRTIQVRSQSRDENDQVVWLVSRTAYDQAGRTIAATDTFIEGTTSKHHRHAVCLRRRWQDDLHQAR